MSNMIEEYFHNLLINVLCESVTPVTRVKWIYHPKFKTQSQKVPIEHADLVDIQNKN